MSKIFPLPSPPRNLFLVCHPDVVHIFVHFHLRPLWMKFLGRIATLPIIAGIGYELIKLSKET